MRKLLSRGESMVPLILPPDEIIVDKLVDPAVDDIVAFKQARSLIVHRVIFVDSFGRFIVTKGDNNRESDGEIQKDRLLGKVARVRREGRVLSLNHVYLAQSSIYLEELSELVKVFDRKEVRYVILKGPPVNILVEDAPPRRLYLDVDLLILKKDLNKVSQILSERGFLMAKGELFGDEISEPTQLTFVKKTKPFPVVVDLHLEVAVGFTRAVVANEILGSMEPLGGYLLRSSRKITIDGKKFRISGKEGIFLILILHFSHHNLKGINSLELAYKLVGQKDFDWRKLIGVVRRFKLENFIYPGVAFLRKYYLITLPDYFFKKVKPDVFRKILSFLLVNFTNPFNDNTRIVSGIKRFFLVFLFSPKPFFSKVGVLFEREMLRTYFKVIKSFLTRTFKKAL